MRRQVPMFHVKHTWRVATARVFHAERSSSKSLNQWCFMASWLGFWQSQVGMFHVKHALREPLPPFAMSGEPGSADVLKCPGRTPRKSHGRLSRPDRLGTAKWLLFANMFHVKHSALLRCPAGGCLHYVSRETFRKVAFSSESLIRGGIGALSRLSSPILETRRHGASGPSPLIPSALNPRGSSDLSPNHREAPKRLGRPRFGGIEPRTQLSPPVDQKSGRSQGQRPRHTRATEQAPSARAVTAVPSGESGHSSTSARKLLRLVIESKNTAVHRQRSSRTRPGRPPPLPKSRKDCGGAVRIASQQSANPSA